MTPSSPHAVQLHQPSPASTPSRWRDRIGNVTATSLGCLIFVPIALVLVLVALPLALIVGGWVLCVLPGVSLIEAARRHPSDSKAYDRRLWGGIAACCAASHLYVWLVYRYFAHNDQTILILFSSIFGGTGM